MYLSGVKINLDQKFLPEIGLGINISNTTKQFIKYSNGDTEIKWRDQSLINGKFNKLSKDFHCLLEKIIIWLYIIKLKGIMD